MISLAYVVAGWLCLVGLYGVAMGRHLVQQVMALSVVQAATYVLLIAAGYRSGASPPIFPEGEPVPQAVDPIVQALVLTDIVVGATVTALLLALAVEIHERTGTLDPDELRPLRPGRSAS